MTQKKKLRQPFACPICGGRKLLPAGFYSVPVGQPFSSTSCNNEICQTCDKDGLVWGDYVESAHDVDEYYPEN